MEVKTIAWILATAVGAILYRMGGSDTWDTKWRDLGCPAVGIALLAYLYPFYNWQIGLAYFLSFGLYFGSLTTYWKKKGSDAKWYNWLFCGMGYSLSFLPFAYVSGNWLGFALRFIVCSLGVMMVRVMSTNVYVEECGSGAISTGTIPLLLI